MFVKTFIEKNKLDQCDAVELTDPLGLKHYAMLVDEHGCLRPRFIGNLSGGVQILSEQQIEEYVGKCEITKIERFPGDKAQRKNAILKALRRVGEKAYNIIFHNCEHFKNWLLYGKATSKQAIAMTTAAGLLGFGLAFLGTHGGSKAIAKAGKIILIFLAVILLVAIVHNGNNPPKEAV